MRVGRTQCCLVLQPPLHFVSRCLRHAFPANADPKVASAAVLVGLCDRTEAAQLLLGDFEYGCVSLGVIWTKHTNVAVTLAQMLSKETLTLSHLPCAATSWQRLKTCARRQSCPSRATQMHFWRWPASCQRVLSSESRTGSNLPFLCMSWPPATSLGTEGPGAQLHTVPAASCTSSAGEP